MDAAGSPITTARYRRLRDLASSARAAMRTILSGSIPRSSVIRLLFAFAAILVAIASFTSAEQQTSLPAARVVRELERPSDTIGVAWSSDGKRIAAFTLGTAANLYGIRMHAPQGNLLTIWDADGEVLRELTRPQPFFAVGD